MSTPFGVAAVTAVLIARLEDRLAEADVQSAIGPAAVTAQPPNEVQAGGAEPSQLNVYLHHVSPTAAWRGTGLPSRDPQGRRIAAPPLAVDLLYLVTAFGVDTYAAEILLGHALAELHERPVLDRDSVDRVLHPAVPDATLPAAVSTSLLERQPEPVRVTPVAVASEEMSRLWTAFGAQYRATAAYQVGPLLIDPAESARPALPVLSRTAGAGVLAPLNVADVVAAPPGEGRPVVTAPILGAAMVLVRGRGLASVDRAVVGRDVVPVSGHRRDGVLVDLGTAPGITPGPVGVQLLQGEVSRSGSVLAVVRPVVTTSRSGTTVRCAVSPQVGRDQRAVLLLNRRGAGPATAYAITAAPGNGAAAGSDRSASVPFDVSAVAAGTYVARLEVDGVASVPGLNGAGDIAQPEVVVP